MFLDKKQSMVRVALMLAVLLVLPGCANYSGSQYSGRQIRSAQTVDYGTVVSVRHVQLENDDPALLGTLGGGAVGGLLGSMVGAGKGRTLAIMGGAAAGAAGGYAAEKAIGKQQGLEIGVRLANGQELSIVQGADEMFTAGERVRVLRGQDGSARVQR